MLMQPLRSPFLEPSSNCLLSYKMNIFVHFKIYVDGLKRDTLIHYKQIHRFLYFAMECFVSH